jgi:ABC-type dipeptide/oligopeptide/nickel transport system ATPase subunit
VRRGAPGAPARGRPRRRLPLRVRGSLLSTAGDTALVVRDVGRVYRHRARERVALSGVSFELALRQTVAVVGESGAGKSTLARLVAGLDRPTSGEILVGGSPPRLRGGTVSPVQMVFQDPKEALNPFLPIGRSIEEPLKHVPRAERRRRVGELLAHVGLDPKRARERPAAFSGGQLQRVVIARALAARPRILVCDEPTSALDVSVQAQIINLLMELQGELGFGCILVTHDLAVVRILANDVLVLRRGVVVEHAPADRFFAGPAEEYSRSLLAAVSRQALTRHDAAYGA